jgi:hypothetical protein
MELNGKLHAIFEIKEKTPTFRTREFVVEVVDEKFSQYQYIKFELVNDKCKLIDNFKLGQSITVNFNITGREWTNPEGEKIYFNSLRAWKIDLAETEDYPSSADEVIDSTLNNELEEETNSPEPPF